MTEDAAIRSFNGISAPIADSSEIHVLPSCERSGVDSPT
jgi:hypothetical protein